VVGLAGKPAKNWWSDVLGNVPQDSSPGPTTLDILVGRGIFPVKEQPHKPKEAYLFHCPFHDDTHPSFSVHENKNQWICFVCGIGGGPAKLALLLDCADPIPRMPQPPKSSKPAAKRQGHPAGCTLQQLAEAKGLPIELLQELGWYDTHWYSTPCVGIRYPNGAMRYRVGLVGDRFRWEKGSSPDLYGRDRIRPTDKILLWVEGETNTVAGIYLGISTVGIPGAGNWNPKWTRHSEGYVNYIWKDPDQGGETLVDAVGQDIPDLRFIDARSAGFKDVCELVSAFEGDVEGARSYLKGLMADAELVNPDSAVRQATATPLYHDAERNVTSRVKDIPSGYYNSIGDKSALRRHAAELFPPPLGEKPWGKTHVLTDDRGDTLLGAFLRSPSWRNPVNAADKLQAAYVNLTKRLFGMTLYELTIPADDWGEKARRALGRRILRAGAKAIHFDNLLALGYVRYLIDTPLKGAVPVTDLEDTLVKALRGIRPPNRGEDANRFHPIDGTPEWVDRIYEDPERDKGKWHAVAVASAGVKGVVDLEIVAVSEGLRYEWVRSYWRLQQGPGILVYGMSVADWLRILEPLGYMPTKLGRHLLKEEVCA
jgi:hypothetical protein